MVLDSKHQNTDASGKKMKDQLTKAFKRDKAIVVYQKS